SVPYLYDNTIGDGPYNAWIDPILADEWQMIGWNNVQEMTRFGMPGVFAHGDFDTWSPGYLMFMAATHNGISRLYETFGNGGTAETMERTLPPSETERTWYRQDPPLPRAKWSMRDNNNYEETGLLVSLNYFASNRRLFLQNFYEKSKRSIAKARTEGPAAYVLPANDPRPGAQADLLRVLQKQHVEISRATAPFSVMIPARHVGRGAAGRGGRGGTGADSVVTERGSAPSPADSATTRPFPAGSYIIRMDQPYSRIADALLDYQYWSPTDPQKTPYDDTGWTFPEGFAVQAVRVTDTTVLGAPMERINGTVVAPGGVTGTGPVFVVNHDGDNALATLRYQFKDADFQAAEAPFEVDGVKYNRGSFLIRGVSPSDLDRATRDLGLQAHAVDVAPSVKTHPLRAARVAIMHTWGSTQTEGWWRQAFDLLHIPYDYISVQDVAKDPDLKARYDVIIFGPGGGSTQSIIEGMPMWRNPMPWKNSLETPNIGTWAQTDDIRPGLGFTGVEHLLEFVRRGGVFIGVNNAADFAMSVGLTNGVSSNPARSKVVGSLLRTRIVDDASPIVYGVIDNLAVFSEGGESFGVSNSRGGRGGGGRGAGGSASRATGRGTPDDPDVVQGRLALGPRFEAPPRQTVQPWQVAPVTDDQLRNPLNVIPPDQRPRVALRFSDQRNLLVSGLLDGGSEIAQRPVVVDSPMEKGHVVLFANNPIYRGETIGSYIMVFNTILNFDNLNAGRTLDSR
ncbi:MAG: M14 family zinc carboxypeptidase, partial [Gemmatimonadales bacterium]